MRSLNIVGCGRAGRSLARVFHQAHAFFVQDLYDSSPAAARACAQFADAGLPVRRLERMRSAQVWLIATPDAAIADAAIALAGAGRVVAGNIVCHVSGATPAASMSALIEQGAHAGSFHPVKTFADPGLAAATFAGTFVALEGDHKALKVLRVALRKAGARVFEIDAANKRVYHAGSVLVCNYLCALLEAGLRCYEASGVRLETAYQLMEPLVRETVDNVFRVGTVRALTGPIARGDDGVVAPQFQDLRRHDPQLGALYRELGLLALDLARSQGTAEKRKLDRIRRILRN
jgi:predicted short-subunit dehydrogenase-like oxidoreductase (DUF2520 family)